MDDEEIEEIIVGTGGSSNNSAVITMWISLIVISVVMFTIAIVKLCKHKKSRGFGIAMLSVDPIIFLATVVSAFTMVYAESEPGSSSTANYAVMIVVAVIGVVLFVANLILGIKLIPKANENNGNTTGTMATNSNDTSTNSDILNYDLNSIKQKGYSTYIETLLVKGEISDEVYKIYKQYIAENKFDRIDLPEEDRAEIDEASKKVADEIQQKLEAQKKFYHGKTPRQHYKQNAIIIGSVAGAVVVACLVFVGLQIFAGWMIGFFIALGLFIAMLWQLWYMKHCCPNCGQEGQIVDSQDIGSTTKIKRKRVTDRNRYNYQGTYSYDKNGVEYVNQLETTVTHEDTLVCPFCNTTWSVKSKRKE